MKLTNVHGLPDIYAEAVAIFDGDYDAEGSEFTASQFGTPIRIWALRKKHWNDLTEDVSDRVWALSGQVFHLIFERLAAKHPERYIAEKRWWALGLDRKVSARIDLYDRQENTLWNGKETKVFKFILGDTKDWEAQLNVERYCFYKDSGINAKTLKVLCKLGDWKIRESKQKKDYPKRAIHVVDIPLWNDAAVEQYIAEKIAAFDAGKDDPPVCTPEERWEIGGSFAVMKMGRKSAVRLTETRETAEWIMNDRAANDFRGTYYIEERIPEPRRCLLYCPVKNFCDFYQYLPDQLKETNETEGGQADPILI